MEREMDSSDPLPLYKIKDGDSAFSAFIRHNVGFKKDLFLIHEMVVAVMKTIKRELLYDPANPYIIVSSYPLERALGVSVFLQSSLQAILRQHLDCTTLDPSMELRGLEFAEAIRLRLLDNARDIDTLIPTSSALVPAPYVYSASSQSKDHVIMCTELFKILHPGTSPSSNFSTITEICSKIINYLKARGKTGSTRWNSKIYDMHPYFETVFSFRYFHETQLPFMVQMHSEPAKPSSKSE